MQTNGQRSQHTWVHRSAGLPTRMRAVLPAVGWTALVIAAKPAWANWGEAAWGELTWGGGVLTEVPALGPVGIGLLTTLVIGAGMIWGRAGASRPRHGRRREHDGG
jgi:hypothetical protein